MAFGNFKPKAPEALARPAKKSRYKGIKSAQPKPPIPHAGDYRFQILQCEEGFNDGEQTHSYKITVGFVEVRQGPHKVGEVATIPLVVEGSKAAAKNLQRLKAIFVAASGFESDEQYDAFDPSGHLFDVCAGTAESDNTMVCYTVVGRLFDCRISRGNDVKNKETGIPTGDYYREYAPSVVSEEEQANQGGIPRVLDQAG
jgi:hypothetical protein